MADPKDYTYSALPATGIDMIQTARGPVHVREVQGTTTMMYDVEGVPKSVLVMSYGTDDETGLLLGMFTQLDAHGAREVGASLIRLANRLDPKATH